MLIQVDVDSTLYDADKLFGDLAEEAGIKWPRRDNEWKSPNEIFDVKGNPVRVEDLKKIFRKAHSREYVSIQTPYPHAVNVLTGIADDYPEVEIAFVSDRNEQQTGALKDWLDKCGFLAGDEFVAATKDKRHWMRERRPEIVIDDRVRTLLMARFELDAYGIGLKHNHNTNLRGEVDNIFILKSWKEIDAILRETVIPAVQGKTVSRTKEI